MKAEIAFILVVCLACVGQGRRVQRQSPRDWEEDIATNADLNDAELGMAYAQAAMNDPAMAEEMKKMMSDPEYLAEVQKMMADPAFQEQAKQAAEQMKASGVDMEEMAKAMGGMNEADLAMLNLKSAMSDPSVMGKMKDMMSDPETMKKMEEMMSDPEFQKQAELVREQARKLARDPKTLEEMRKMMEDPEFQEQAQKYAAREWELENMAKQQKGEMNLAEVGMANLKEAMADPAVISEMQEMMNDPEIQAQLKEMMADPEWQKQVQTLLNDPENMAQLQDLLGEQQK
mmetsp:Transcript_67515/g.119840  ORF Transcript_67515/g.119840 Transcript_67515/m.119840 type:complete len:288 (+) Transcript_67515:108-971(+)